jgi:hypothetical protein
MRGNVHVTTGSTLTISLSLESAILARAQETVDHWLHADDRGPFRQAVTRAVMTYWADLSQADGLHDVFYRVANAIRLGQGHARLNPDPLLRIIRQAFGRGSSLPGGG